MHSRYNLKNNQIRPKSKGIAIRVINPIIKKIKETIPLTQFL